MSRLVPGGRNCRFRRAERLSSRGEATARCSSSAGPARCAHAELSTSYQPLMHSPKHARDWQLA
jgi:hypothetical protein